MLEFWSRNAESWFFLVSILRKPRCPVFQVSLEFRSSFVQVSCSFVQVSFSFVQASFSLFSFVQFCSVSFSFVQVSFSFVSFSFVQVLFSFVQFHSSIIQFRSVRKSVFWSVLGFAGDSAAKYRKLAKNRSAKTKCHSCPICALGVLVALRLFSSGFALLSFRHVEKNTEMTRDCKTP